MSFSQGMTQGQQMVGNAWKLYQTAKGDSELGEIAKAKAEESTGFTADQGKELEGFAKQGFDNITFDDKANAYVAKNAAGEAKTVAMGGVTDFLGERTAGSMSREQQDGTRAMAMADVVGRYDPARGIQMRQQVQSNQFAAKRQGREEKQWGKEDSIEALDKELGAQFEQSLLGEDGQRRAPTATDYLQSNQQRAFKLAQGGHMKEAEAAFKDNLSTAHVKIQLDSAERKQALGPAMAALSSGDYGAVADFYNKYVPSGVKVTGIEPDKDGGLVMQRAGMNGQPLAPLRAKDQREAMAMLQSFENPNALYQYSQDEFRNQLSLKADKRADHADVRAGNADNRAAGADSRAAASHNAAMGDRREMRDVREALARETDPGMTPTQLRAVRAGILQTPGTDDGGKYNANPVMVQKAFGEFVPGNDLKGTKDSIKRNPEKEKRFEEFMADNKIRDVEKGLTLFNQAEVQRGRKETAATDGRRTESVRQTGAALSPEMIAQTARNKGASVAQVAQLLEEGGVPVSAEMLQSAQALMGKKQAVARTSPAAASSAPAQAQKPATASSNFYGEEQSAARNQARAQKEAAAAQEAQLQAQREEEREAKKRQQMQRIGQAMEQMKRPQ